MLSRILPYWPILAATLLFLVLGLWWRLVTARAMERAPKPLGWVLNYRSGGYALPSHLPPQPRLRWWMLLIVLLAGAAFAAGHLANTGMIYLQQPEFFFSSRYGIMYVCLRALGAAAVYCVLTLLFDRSWVSLPGALLCAASAARGQGEGSFLALALLFLLLYLRAKKPGFPAELLYLAAILMLAPIVALRPALCWLVLGLPAAHWYKLDAQRRSGTLSGGKLVWSLLAALLVWVLASLLAALLRRWLMTGFHFGLLLHILQPQRLLRAWQALAREIPRALWTAPTRGMTIDLMVDAPLFALGLWGCCSAWIAARKRRSARGGLQLAILGLLLAVWLLTSRYMLSVGLVIAAAAALADADMGKKRVGTLLLTLGGICWYVCIQLAAWYVPLTAGLVERLT